jgi:imidazolonepropionase-like amidohydrolase
MRSRGVLTVAALVCLAVPAAVMVGQGGGGEKQAEVVVLRAARLFDGKSDAPVRDGVVVVEGGRIKAAGAGLAAPAGARVIDLGDATLLPGLIDAHTHLSGESSDDWLQDTVSGLRRTLAEAAIRATKYARATLASGFRG